MSNKKAVVLLSGGMDSATVLAVAGQEYELHALSFRYGQCHSVELEAARKVAMARGVIHHAIVDISLFGGSSLTGDTGTPGAVPAYVPARNTIFLSHALSYAETVNSADIFIGVNSLDYAGYPDCRPEYIAAFEQMANLATTMQQIRIHAPLISMTKKEIVQMGISLGVDYSLTHSCYYPDGTIPCGKCDACILRTEAFRDI